MRKFRLFLVLWGVLIATALASPMAISDEDDDDGENHPLFNNRHALAEYIGITSEDFWENDDDDDDYSARECRRQRNNTPAKLLNCVTLDGVRTHQRAWQDIADANGGTRSADSTGYEASANYVRDQLLAAGYEVSFQAFDFLVSRVLGPSTLSQVREVYVEEVDYTLMAQSDAGNVTANVTAVDLDLGLGNSSTSGCEAEDFSGFPAGDIALIQRGLCNFSVKAENAAAAGAVGAIIFNQGNSPDRFGLINGSTLGAGYSGGIPVVFATYDRGFEWSGIIGLELTLIADVERKIATTNNVIAETAGGNPDNVVMLGAHLDSVFEGPGINDNGSGSGALLETALQLKKHQPDNKLRFAWWSAEESGLVGSDFYALGLSDEEVAQISVYLNFDMVGSPNFARFVYDGDGSDFDLEGPAGSAAVEEYFELFYSVQGLAFEGTEISFRSDYAGFFDRGVAFGGLFTGAEGIKSAEQQAMYGGIEGDQFDPCYHLACDTFENVDLDVLSLNADSLALAALLFSYTTAPIDAQKAPQVGINSFATRSAKVSASSIETRGDYYVK